MRTNLHSDDVNESAYGPTAGRRSLRAGLALGVSSAMLLAFAPAVWAQDADDEEENEVIIVTGSRIANSNLTSPSPITSVGELDLSLSNTVNSEQFLNTLPQFIPGNDSSSNNPGTGEADINLRGLGSNRTLVLVNGRRYVSSNQNPGVVDLNTIPTSLVEQVDIVTGGLSAIYGSDAMAGVVNFTLKDDFEGAQLDTSYEISEEGDAGIFNADVTVGGDIADGRGNIVFNIGYTYRDSVFQGDRPEAFFTLNDAGADGGFSETGSVNIPSTFVLDFSPNYTEALGIQAPCDVEGTALSDDGFCTTDSFGWIFNPDGAGALPFINSGPNTNRYNYAPVNYLQLPQERYNIFTAGTYELTDNVEAFGQAVFVSSQTEQLLAPSPVFTTVTVNLDNPFLAGDAESLALLTALSAGDSDGNGVDDAVIATGRRSTEVDARSSKQRNDSFQVQGGFRGDLGADWRWNVFGSYGQASTTVSQSGNVSLPDYQAAIREGRANIFDADGVDPDVVAEYTVLGMITGVTEETVLSADVSGELAGIASPFAETPIGVAFGAEYRENALSTEGTGLGEDIVGFNQAPDTAGRYDVSELFGELNVPLIEGAAFAEEITLSGAYRFSDYSTVGSVSTYMGGVSWTPIEGYRLRGVYQRAARAPNIGELFQPQVNNFPNIADPCSSGLGGWDALSAEQQTVVNAQCIANGVPAAQVGTAFQVNAQIEGLFGGNPDLQEEVGDTFTIGGVLEPSFIPNLAVTVDYFDIQIEDVISNVPSQTIFDLCFIEGVDSFCQNITRTPQGPVDIFNSAAVNAAKLVSKGFDVTVDYTFDLGEFGSINVYNVSTKYTEASFQSLPTEAAIDCNGFYGATCGEPSPEWSFNTRFDWSMGPWAARLRWTHISSLDDDLFLDGGEPDLFVPGTDAYDQVDLTGYYDLNEHVLLSLGVENLFDTDYVLIGDASAEQSNTYPATFDTIGRTWFGRLVVDF